MTHFEIILTAVNVLFLIGCVINWSADDEANCRTQAHVFGKLVENWFSDSDSYHMRRKLRPKTLECMDVQLKKEIENYFSGERLEKFWDQFKDDLVHKSLESTKNTILREVDKEIIEEIKRTRTTEILKLVDVQAIASAVSLKASAAILQLVPDQQNQVHYDMYGTQLQLHDANGNRR